MPSLAETQAKDSIGLPRFEEQRCGAMVNHVRKNRLLESEPPDCTGCGIVIAGGGKYLSWSWVLCRRLRELGCELPIQVWHIGEKEMPVWAAKSFAEMGVETVNVLNVLKKHMVRQMSGWVLKNYAVTHSPWRHVMFIDADCFPVVKPETIFQLCEGKTLFFNDVKPCHPSRWGYTYCGLSPDVEWETGQFIVDKVEGWMGLRWTGWLNEHTDCWFNMLHGDKGTFELGFRMSGVPIEMGDTPKWCGFGIAHSYKGVAVFEHCMATKRGEWPMEPWLKNLFKEWDAVSLGKQK